MSDEMSDQLRRLKDESGSLEQELLRSALADRPAPRVEGAVLAYVVRERRREQQRQRKRGLVLAGASLAVAAAVFVLARGNAPAPNLDAERPKATTAARRLPSASAAPAQASPFAPCSPVKVGSGSELLIDDFEDGDTRIPLVDERAGAWIAYNDGTATQHPRPGSTFPADRIPGGRGGSRFGLHVRGGKFSKWGAALAIELSPRRCYDASAYAGVAFWARGRAELRVNLKMVQVVTEEYGGSCQRDCYDSHGAPRTLTRDWRRYEVRWEDVAQSGFGAALPFDPHSLYSVELTTLPAQPSFDYWVDDFAFIAR
jgi:hypothetical protein